MSFKPLITEKTSKLVDSNIYVFYIDSNLNKIEFRKLLQDKYNAKISKINVLTLKGKPKLRPKKGKTVDRKKAYVTFYKDSNLDQLKELF